ncbi:hypothetical protein [Tropicibacter sp. Alg240-R139]|uniref:hypothetical protein n=1 Tax=Tropicibacter sp. Alg240-R139 TaxID=2305991 RepID=UPI0013E0E229|nr:hypothetical protein [Tropicibacter sp. Alg240-R139]
MVQTSEQMKFEDDNGHAGFCMTKQHIQVERVKTTTNPLLWNMLIGDNAKTLMVGQVGALKVKYETEEFVVWHRVGNFEQDEELEMLENYTKVIKAIS